MDNKVSEDTLLRIKENLYWTKFQNRRTFKSICQSIAKKETSETIKTLKTAWIKELRITSENDAGRL